MYCEAQRISSHLNGDLCITDLEEVLDF